jgi:amidase
MLSFVYHLIQQTMNFTEYRSYDALGLAALVRQGEVTATELLELAIARNEQVHPSINAVIHPMYEEGRQLAAAVDKQGPFAGVPFLIKDLGLEVKGHPLLIGTKGYKGYVSQADSFLVNQFRQAGLVFFGKTNTPEFGLTPYTEPVLHGPTRNPWDTSRSAGGSSGGSAAAVAAGITPMATASDGGGSIRIPASCNGLFGLKPGRGRLSFGHLKGEMWSGAIMEGCVSRSVRDSAAFLDAFAMHAPGDPFQIAPPLRPYLQEVQHEPGQLRIGWSTHHLLGHAIAPDCITAVNEAIALLESLGHIVEEVKLPFEKEDLTEVFLMMVFGELAADLADLEKHLGRRIRPADVEDNTYALGILGRSYSARDYALQRRRWNDIARRSGLFHQQYDLLLTPTVSKPPFTVGALQPSAAERRLVKFVNAFGLGSLLKANVGELAEKVFGYIPFTPFANLTGQPSMSVPLYWNDQNLPVGVMFSADTAREDILFRLAGQLERAKPWFDKIPPL